MFGKKYHSYLFMKKLSRQARNLPAAGRRDFMHHTRRFVGYTNLHFFILH
jgi:hypothetical protein